MNSGLCSVKPPTDLIHPCEVQNADAGACTQLLDGISSHLLQLAGNNGGEQEVLLICCDRLDRKSVCQWM
jgi:hypothetical protein